MNIEHRFAPLITWRQKKLPKNVSPRVLTSAQVADYLSVEKVEKSGIKVPERLYKDLVAFRKLRQDARVAAIRNALNGQPGKAKPAKQPERDSTIIAVCGYLSQRCSSMQEAKDWLEERLARKTYPRGFIVNGQVTVVEKKFEKLSRSIIK